MIHQMVHLVHEVKFCRPVYLRWMHLFETYMKLLKGYMKNQNRPEGCIIESYIAEKSIEFCSKYLSNTKTSGVPKTINIKARGLSISNSSSVNRGE